jgi:hypothetical protein
VQAADVVEHGDELDLAHSARPFLFDSEFLSNLRKSEGLCFLSTKQEAIVIFPTNGFNLDCCILQVNVIKYKIFVNSQFPL